jgi:hypothetical protein
LLVSFFRERGKPRYLHGKLASSHGSRFYIVDISVSPHLLGNTLLFYKFVLSPVASPNRSRMPIIKLISPGTGLRNNTTSFA